MFTQLLNLRLITRSIVILLKTFFKKRSIKKPIAHASQFNIHKINYTYKIYLFTQCSQYRHVCIWKLIHLAWKRTATMHMHLKKPINILTQKKKKKKSEKYHKLRWKCSQNKYIHTQKAWKRNQMLITIISFQKCNAILFYFFFLSNIQVS